VSYLPLTPLHPKRPPQQSCARSAAAFCGADQARRYAGPSSLPFVVLFSPFLHVLFLWAFRSVFFQIFSQVLHQRTLAPWLAASTRSFMVGSAFFLLGRSRAKNFTSPSSPTGMTLTPALFRSAPPLHLIFTASTLAPREIAAAVGESEEEKS
jgi:hypothetical protein